jgi:hypothetical protein
MTTVDFFNVFEVHGDGGERSSGPVIGYASTEDKAKVMAHGKGFFGSDGVYFEVPAIKVNDKIFVLKKDYPVDLDDTQATKDAELRSKTLASLTPEQKRVLGLS